MDLPMQLGAFEADSIFMQADSPDKPVRPIELQVTGPVSHQPAARTERAASGGLLLSLWRPRPPASVPDQLGFHDHRSAT